MNDRKEGVAKVTCPTFEAMRQIPAFHRTYFLFSLFFVFYIKNAKFDFYIDKNWHALSDSSCVEDRSDEWSPHLFLIRLVCTSAMCGNVALHLCLSAG